MNDTQTAFSHLYNELSNLHDKYFPKRRIQLKYNYKKPWLSEGLRQAIKTKNKLHRKSVIIKSSYNESTYKRYRNKLRRVLLSEEKRYYAELLHKNKNNMKKTWLILKNIVNKGISKRVQSTFRIHDDTIISDKAIISVKFNDFFINIGPTLAKKIPSQIISPLQFMGERVFNSLFLEPVYPGEIDMIVKNLKHSAPGHDEITTAILQLALPAIRTSLVHVMNLSLAEGIFPDELKVAKVLPLYKGDNPILFNNCRPVSLLNILSKVFEKVMYTRLVSFFENQKILYNKQFGFRILHSTYMALMLLIDKLTNAIEKGEYGIGVFLDFSKAFDTVDHAILLSKLYHYGVRGSALSWFTSYLSNRKQNVSYNNVSSNIKTISCGVPQGSLLGPVLFYYI